MSGAFTSFQMPDFKSRPDGISKSLKDAYSYLRGKGFPDKDIFIFPQGRFTEFKGEILDQRPEPGEMVGDGTRITIIAAVPGICEIMPDLFTDHRDDFFDEEFNNRGGAKRLFAIFDSAIIKMLCKLEWIRDIYGGINQSEAVIQYFAELLNLPERNIKQIAPDILGYVLPSLYGNLGTEGALRIYLETVMGLESQVRVGGYEEYELPPAFVSKLGERGRIGNDFYLGQTFKGASAKLIIDLLLSNPDLIRDVIPNSKGDFLLRKILEFNVPQTAEAFRLNMVPDPATIRFKSGSSHLGYGTVLGEIPE